MGVKLRPDTGFVVKRILHYTSSLKTNTRRTWSNKTNGPTFGRGEKIESTCADMRDWNTTKSKLESFQKRFEAR